MTLSLKSQGHTTLDDTPYRCIVKLSKYLHRLLRYNMLCDQVHLPTFDAWLPWQHIFPTIKMSVRLSICLTVTRVICDKTKQSCAHFLSRRERTFILVFETRRIVVSGRRLLPEILGKVTQLKQRNANFQSLLVNLSIR